jgi:hypothetical protein
MSSEYARNNIRWLNGLGVPSALLVSSVSDLKDSQIMYDVALYVFEGKKRSLFEDGSSSGRRSNSDIMHASARLFAKHGYFRCDHLFCDVFLSSLTHPSARAAFLSKPLC